jgi:hypothetical protein
MKTIKKLLLSVLTISLFLPSIFAQTESFDVNKYKSFLEQNQNMTSDKLKQLYPAGNFKAGVTSNISSALYYDSVCIKYALTDYEKSLLLKNGFMVTERLNEGTFGQQFDNIYRKDLPVFVSTDAISHAFHASYDKILSDVEVSLIIPKLKILLYALNGKNAELAARYAAQPEMQNSLKDADVYFTIALKLLGETVSPYYSANDSIISQFLDYIKTETAVDCKIFGDSYRKIDFSQFKPRAHYVSPDYPILANYFQCMMWLGRIEIYLTAPKSDEYVLPADLRRQSADAMLILESAERSNSFDAYNELNNLIGFFVGDQDNVTLTNLKDLRQAAGLTNAGQLLDSLTYEKFADTLKTESYAYQKILSQILSQGPLSPDSVVPASSFMLLGQRFVIDSYITGNVVYDRIKAVRLLPSTQDILFALGNNASARLLETELAKYGYSKNLAGLRYLIDSYGSDFWNSTIYNAWLNSIRKLNPPEDKSTLPEFMQTAAYWQEKINSQLGTWTELRHDNLLYAKQSYTALPACSFPYGYVEPVPAFYLTLSAMAQNAEAKFKASILSNSGNIPIIIKYFDFFAKICDTLTAISQKELSGVALSNSDNIFLKRMLYEDNFMCSREVPEQGWYPDLYYGDYTGTICMAKKDIIVADFHTSPGDEGGNMAGYVKHSGTGSINLGVWVADLPGVGKVAFTGPVSSYYEYTTTNFLRLTDDEWANTYLQQASRPDYVNLYLANNTGASRGAGYELTAVKENTETNKTPNQFTLMHNYPNPFNPSTVIGFTIPYNLANQNTELVIYNIKGEVVKRLLNKVLPAGTYYTRWEGDNSYGKKAASGVYLYQLKVGSQKQTGKMNLVK